MSDETKDPREAVLEIPRTNRSINHYPLADGTVVLRYRHSDDPDERGWIVEANVGGVLMEGAGHYGDSLYEARNAAARLKARLDAAYRLSQETDQ